eukprot:2067689-Lingulodinium_polyedra.AAC.1
MEVVRSAKHLSRTWRSRLITWVFVALSEGQAPGSLKPLQTFVFAGPGEAVSSSSAVQGTKKQAEAQARSTRKTARTPWSVGAGSSSLLLPSPSAR